jgi:hypothetical protein
MRRLACVAVLFLHSAIVLGQQFSSVPGQGRSMVVSKFGIVSTPVAAMDAVKSELALHDGNGEEAIAMAQQAIDLWTQAHALAIVEAAIGRDTVDFLSAEVVYAGILRASGAKQEGSNGMTKNFEGTLKATRFQG